jgi:TPR repeat protein
MLFLGNLNNGLGPEGSPSKAAYWYLEVCGHSGAEPRAVSEARAAVEELTSLLVLGAYTGDADAAFALGGWHMTCEVDPSKAAGWFEQGAAKGHAGAQRSLAYLLLEGRGVAENKPRAIELFEAAARAGDRFAQFNLGSLYALGEFLPKDSEKAVAYLTAAAEQGLLEAMARLGDELGRLDRDGEARGWYVRAAERGHAGAMRAAADWYRDGLGGPRDLVQAVRWYWAMLSVGNGDGIHEVHQLAEQMTDNELREAARLSGDPVHAEALLVSSGRSR